MNGVLFARISSVYARNIVRSQTRYISVTCCRNQQATKVKSPVDEKTKKASSEKENPKSSTDASEKLVFQENSPAYPAPTAEGETPVFSPKIVRIVDEIAKLTLVEVSDLNKALKIKLNLPDVPVFAAGAAVPAAAAGKSEEDESAPSVAAAKTKFNIKLTKIDDSKKIAVIKEIKALMPNLNLVQAKKVVETLPQVIKTDILKDEAEKVVAQLSSLGAQCEID